VGILGSTSAKSSAAVQKYGVDRAYSNYDELLKDQSVGCVHILTPNRFHFDMASRALRAGKHVMCEKPLAMDSKESSELVRIARDSGLEAGVNYNIRYYPLNIQAHGMVKNGQLGPVHGIFGGYVQDWLLYKSDYNWRVLDDQGGLLRAVSDVGTHWIDLVTFITGKEIEAVFADLMTLHPERLRPLGEVETFSAKSTAETEAVPIVTDDVGSVLFRFAGGGRACMWVSQVTAGRKNCLRYEISGAERSLYWNSEEPNRLWVGARSESNKMLLKDPSLMDRDSAHFADYPAGHNEGYPDSFKMCFRAFYDRIAKIDGGFAYPTFADGDRDIKVCDAILESHRSQKWVQVLEN
jgi:predicted dehydrogenase